MTHGIRIIWPGENGKPANPVAIEYFYGMDTDKLDEIEQIMPLHTTQAWWPQDNI